MVRFTKSLYIYIISIFDIMRQEQKLTEFWAELQKKYLKSERDLVNESGQS